MKKLPGKRPLAVLGVVLLVPLIGLGVSEGIKAHFNTKLRSALAQDYPSASATDIARENLDSLCKEADFSSQAICSMNRNLDLTVEGSASSAGAGLLLLAVIWLAGAVSRQRRRLLLYLFKPGLYLTVAALIGLTIVNAVILISALYYGVSTFAPVIPIGILFGIAIAAAFGVLVLARASVSVLGKEQIQAIATSVDREDAPQLWQKVDELAAKLGTLHPERIVIGLEPNFFVAEADVTCLSGKQRGRTLYCSLPLCRILSLDEFRAVVGHELGHFRGLDTKFSEKFFPIYRGTAESIAALSRGKGGTSFIVLLPTLVILGYFLQCFAIAEREISRNRELRADEAGASLNSPAVMASALVKVHAFSRLWIDFQKAVLNALRQGKAFANASLSFAHAVGDSAKPEVFLGIADAHLSHPTDTHPPLGERLKNLGISLENVQSTALDVHPAATALDLIPDAEAKESELSRAFQAILAKRFRILVNTATAEKEEAAT